LNDAKDQEYEDFKAKKRAEILAKEIADNKELRTKISEEVIGKLDPRLKEMEETLGVLKKSKLYTDVEEDEEFDQELGD
jgi:hypothetical protein